MSEKHSIIKQYDILLPGTGANGIFKTSSPRNALHIKIDTRTLYKKKNFLRAALDEAILGYSHRNNDNDNLSEP